MKTTSAENTIDYGWFRTHLLDDILPRWLSSSVTDNGLFIPHLGRRWNRLEKEYGTTVSQTRLLYNFSKGYELTGDEAYLKAVELGAGFLLERFWDAENGGWFHACNTNGEVLNPNKFSYGHTFVLFGFCHAFRVSGNRAFKNAALDTWEILSKHFIDRYGGLKAAMTRDFKECTEPNSQNPIMHLFEAILAFGALDGMDYMFREAERIADFVLSKLVRQDDHILPEIYTSDWTEEQTGKGGRIDIGHAFEWAFLLSTAVESGLPEIYLDQAERFIDYGLRIGFDSVEGGIYSPASPEGVAKDRKGWWEQCEATRALMRFAVVHNREDLWLPLRKTIDFIQQNFVDPEHRGWFMSAGDDSTVHWQNKGDEYKVDYHVVGMCMEAIRLEHLYADRSANY